MLNSNKLKTVVVRMNTNVRIIFFYFFLHIPITFLILYKMYGLKTAYGNPQREKIVGGEVGDPNYGPCFKCKSKTVIGGYRPKVTKKGEAHAQR